jgi:hypothetical protein
VLYAFGFDRVGIVVSDLFFIDPNPGPGQEGPEQGVRLELRAFVAGELEGSIYSARPIAVDRPIWRVDLLESVDHPGSLDRAHHHPRFDGWEPGRRHFAKEMKADPVAWVGDRLRDLDGLLTDAGVDASQVGATDADDLRRSVPEILRSVDRLLERARGTAHQTGLSARDSWL